MRIILIGANGFLGKAIYRHFAEETVFRLGRTEGEVIGDLAYDLPELPVAELVIHAAGKAHSVPQTAEEKEVFYQVNVAGTKRLLSALSNLATLPKYFVFISSVAVYGLAKGALIDEDQPLAATDPYGKSKIDAEALVTTWCKENDVVCSILRLPLLAGPNPPGNLQSMIKAIQKGYYFDVNVPDVKKSMVLIDDVATFIGQVYPLGGIFNLTDGYHPSFREISNLISKQLHRKNAVVMPYALIKGVAFVGDFLGPRFPLNSNKLDKITNTLTFSDQKARAIAGWQPQAVLAKFTI